MPKVRLLPHPDLCPEGREIELPKGESLCEGFLNHGIAIEHACEMVAACATCHVYVREGGASLSKPKDDEEDQLDHARLRIGQRQPEIIPQVRLRRHAQRPRRDPHQFTLGVRLVRRRQVDDP